MKHTPKNCEVCGVKFLPGYKMTVAYWAARKYCSHDCMHKAQRGVRLPTYGRHRVSLSDRFWSKVDKRGKGECWLWTGARTNGYGKIGERHHTGGDKKAHRVSYELNIRPIPKGLCVCHKCDNPLCVNPDHLFTGTLAENNYDRETKGRGSDKRGAKNPRARLTLEMVAEIRMLRADGLSQQAIADRVGYPQSKISNVLRGVGWIPEVAKV